MQNYAIGLSGLNAAQTGLDIVGNNIANAATEGYHRQRVELAPSAYGQSGALAIGGGVDIAGVTRMIDGLLEREILRQEAWYGQISQELSTLNSVETAFGEFTEGSGLNATMDAFFDALRALATHPLEPVWRHETVNSAEALAAEFRRMGSALESLENQIVLEAQHTAETINTLIEQIAELNGKIQSVGISQGQAGNLRDRRDQVIAELAKLVNVETQAREHGVVDVSIAGLPVVAGAIAFEVEVGLQSDRTLGVWAEGGRGHGLDVQGGRLGGLLSLKNGLLSDVRDDLDTLAKAIIDQVNRYHVQGAGLDGSFMELTGWVMGSDDLADAEASITDGTFYIRLTNTATGELERHAIDVDLSGVPPDTLTSVAAKIDAVSGLSASVVSSRLHLVADLGYTFDFIPAVLPGPSASNLTAVSPPTVSVGGLYNGDANQTFTFTIVGNGSVGNGDLRISVTDEAGGVVDTLNIGAGYAAGDTIELYNGIKISVSMGDLNNGDSFEVAAFATTDTSGFLAATGMNTFFSGTGASDMHVCRDVVDEPDRIATALGSDLTDNAAALRLARVRDEVVGSLGDMTPSEYYQRTAANLGQQVSLKQSRQDNIEAMLQNLQMQRTEISGVDINDEAAQLLVFEKMFQAVAKYLNTLQTAMATLMDLV